MARVLSDWNDVMVVAQAWRKRLEDSGWVETVRRSVTRH
jgi:hypothetical protein